MQGAAAGRQADGRPCPNTVKRADPEAAAREILAGADDCAAGRTAFGSKKTKPGGQTASKDPNITDLETSISNRLGLKVQIIHKGDKGGEVRISYATLEQLDEIARRLSKTPDGLSECCAD